MKEKFLSFLKRQEFFLTNCARDPQGRQPQQYGTPQQVPKSHVRHTTQQKKKPPRIFREGSVPTLIS